MTLTGQQEEESSLDDVGVMDFRNKLRRCVELNKKGTDQPVVSEGEKEAEETRLFSTYYHQWKGEDNCYNTGTYRIIPKFYHKLPSEDEILLQKVREEARALFLQRRSRDLLGNEELQHLWFLLDKHHTPPVIADEQMINYTDFLKVSTEAGTKCKSFFTATVFAKLYQKEPHGRISIMQFFNYVMRKVWLHQTRIGLSLYDVTGLGYLKEIDLENYILELIPTLPRNSQIQTWISGGHSIPPDRIYISFLSFFHIYLRIHERYLSHSLTRSLSCSFSLSHSLSLSVCLSRSPSLSLCLSRSLSLSLCLSRSPSLSLCLSRSPSLSLSVCLAHHLSLSLSVSLTISLSLCLSRSPSLSLSVCLLTISLSLCLSGSPSLSLSVSLTISLSLCLSRSPSLSLSRSPSCFILLSFYLNVLERSFYSFYVCTAVRKFFFFLDPMRTGKIKILDILACSFLDDLLELRDEELSREMQESNWFSAPSALRVYGQYLNLDRDHNGMLSKEELARYGTGTLTDVFLDRVFQECLTYDGEMDYKTYLDFVLALENRKEPQALQYLFRILDVEQKGFLNVFSLNYFYRAIQEQMRRHNQDPISFEDVKDEIFDMVKPKDPLKITLQDLIYSGKGDTVLSILIDLNDFWTYENREYIVLDAAAATSDADEAEI
ncbi:PPP2R3 [Acanthosepion pharaonis]|uniref:PPP2R3 n=1 Tax=Acanthosepion pharaonis TaxID=158019 RepID=A0A812BA91_ACAPH|nr:PPP2R3 [Sepia pharaonis]